MEENLKGDSVSSSEGLLVDYVQVQIHVPEINAYKCLQFRKSQLVWDVKQQTLAALPKVCYIDQSSPLCPKKRTAILLLKIGIFRLRNAI